MEESVIEYASKYSQRKSRNFWINDPQVLQDFMTIARRVNKYFPGWNYDINAIEPLQYTEYSSEVQGHYDFMLTNIQNHMTMVELERLVFQFY